MVEVVLMRETPGFVHLGWQTAEHSVADSATRDTVSLAATRWVRLGRHAATALTEVEGAITILWTHGGREAMCLEATEFDQGLGEGVVDLCASKSSANAIAEQECLRDQH
jgi:hypothetical protein